MLEIYRGTLYTDGYFIIETTMANGDPGADYPIAADRITRPINLVQWIYHLSNKPWMGHGQLKNFIAVVCEAKGWTGTLQNNGGSASVEVNEE